MKKPKYVLLFALLTAMLLLCGFKAQETTPCPEFPDVTWGMTAEEVLEAFDVTAEDVTVYHESDISVAFSIDNGCVLFGADTEKILFNFIDPQKGKGTPKLCLMDITYPDTADMVLVAENMEAVFGDCADTIRRYGGFQLDDELPSDDYEQTDHLKLWASETIKEVIPDGQNDNCEKYWEGFQAGLTKENWEEFSENACLVTAACASEEDAFPKFEKNGVSIDASNLIIYQWIEEETKTIAP